MFKKISILILIFITIIASFLYTQNTRITENAINIIQTTSTDAKKSYSSINQEPSDSKSNIVGTSSKDIEKLKLTDSKAYFMELNRKKTKEDGREIKIYPDKNKEKEASKILLSKRLVSYIESRKTQ